MPEEFTLLEYMQEISLRRYNVELFIKPKEDGTVSLVFGL